MFPFQDVQYGDIDIMDKELDFTVNNDRFKGLPEYVEDLKAKGIKFVTILVSPIPAWKCVCVPCLSFMYDIHMSFKYALSIQDPCISIAQPAGSYPPFDVAKDKDIWVKKADGTNVVGKVWPNSQQDPVYFPDYSNPETRTWWSDQIKTFKTLIKFDALWIV
jgi:alpha-glucosidase (family GH31 glycosyl hydrolase)